MKELSGVQTVDFDCKTATLTMTEGSSLSHEAATEAIVQAGFSITKIEEGAAPKVTAYLFQVTGIGPGTPATARQALIDALGAPDFVAVDATGAAVVTLRGDKMTSEPALGDSLRKAGFGLEGLSVRDWPTDPAVYVMELPDVTDVSAAKTARAALVALEKVFWAEVHPEQKSATIFLNEPCDEIEGKVRGALANSNYGVSQFRLSVAGGHSQRG